MNRSNAFLRVLMLVTFGILICTILIYIINYKKEKTDHVLKLAEQDYILYDKEEKIHNDSEVRRAIEKGLTLYDFAAKFDIGYYKKYKQLSYVVLQTEKRRVAVFFLESGQYDHTHDISFSKDENEEGIENLQPGVNLKEVLAKDPDGRFNFMFASWSGYPKVSYHYFKSGKCYEINYNEDLNIVGIISYTI